MCLKGQEKGINRNSEGVIRESKLKKKCFWGFRRKSITGEKALESKLKKNALGDLAGKS